MKYLADTNFLSEFLKPRPNPGALKWLLATDETEIGISVVTIGEIARGIARSRPGARQQRLQVWLDGYILTRFSDRIVPVGLAEMLEWGRRYGEFERQGSPRPVIDSLLAVTAQVNELSIVSRNVRDFDRWDVPVINPWDDENGA